MEDDEKLSNPFAQKSSDDYLEFSSSTPQASPAQRGHQKPNRGNWRGNWRQRGQFQNSPRQSQPYFYSPQNQHQNQWRGRGHHQRGFHGNQRGHYGGGFRGSPGGFRGNNNPNFGRGRKQVRWSDFDLILSLTIFIFRTIRETTLALIFIPQC